MKLSELSWTTLKTKLQYLFWTPDSFQGQPKAYAANQTGHFILGAAAAVFFPITLIALVYAAWEGAQWKVAGGDPEDCVEDWSFVILGAMSLIEPFSLVLALVLLALGYWKRSK